MPRRWRRTDRLPVGQSARGSSARRGRTLALCRLAMARPMPSTTPAPRTCSRAVKGHHRRPGREVVCTTRWARTPGTSRSELPAPLRPDGQLRQRVGAGAAVCAWHSWAPKGSLYVTRQTLFTHRHAREATRNGRRAVCRGGKRQVQTRIDQRYRWPRCSAGPPRPGSPQRPPAAPS